MIIHECEQNSDEWHALRAGIPTASAFSNIITSKGVISKSIDDYAIVLASEKFMGEPDDTWQGNRHTERGHELEAQARSAYGLINDVQPVVVGFVTNDQGTIGCSPDSLIGDDGTLEIKCLSGKEHIKALMYYQKHGMAQPKYFQQTQGQIMICERVWSDLWFYHPKLPSFSIRADADTEFQMNINFGIEKLYSLRDLASAVLENA